jgi:hypothetical protein
MSTVAGVVVDLGDVLIGTKHIYVQPRTTTSY